MNGYYGGQAGGINEKGEMVGTLLTSDPLDWFRSVPALWKNGTVTVLGMLGGDFGTTSAINDHGQIVGFATTADGAFHGVIWENGVPIDVGSLGGSWTALWDNNNKGQAVGEASNANEEVHAILVENGVMVDLNDRIPPNSGWLLVGAGGINEKGQIAGLGILNGEVRAFLLTPVR